MRIFTKTFLLYAMAFFSLTFTACKDEDVSVTAKTYNVTNINSAGGSFRGTVTISGTDLVDAGIVYSTSVKYPKINNSRYVSGALDSLTDFTVVLSGLSPDSTYRFCTYARISDSTYYGTAYSFRPVKINISTIPVQGGTFMMGATDEQSAYAQSDEYPVHSVSLSNYLIGQYEVTNAEFVKFLNSRCTTSSGLCVLTDGVSRTILVANATNKALYYESDSSKWLVHDGYENVPVVNVTWYGAQDFCLWAGGRLPTEAEWEYAARDRDSNHYIYSGSDKPRDVAWFHGNIASYYAQPVGTKQKNGLLQTYDMSGNASEWVYDWYDKYSSRDLINPCGVTDDVAENIGLNEKVIRGGSWADTDSSALRVSSRATDIPADKSYSIGFRFAKSVE